MFHIEGCPVPVYQDEGEIKQLIALIQDLQPKRILEVGSFYGGTLWYWMHAVKGAEIVSVDSGLDVEPWLVQGAEQARTELWPEWERETENKIVQIRADSTLPDTVASVKEYAPFDFIFIDGGHNFAPAMADWQNYWPMLRTGGLFAFHDIVYLSSGAPAVWRTVRNHGKWQEIIREHNPEGLWGIGVMWKE
jgi:predicted O-methyltransferase YrrM